MKNYHTNDMVNKVRRVKMSGQRVNKYIVSVVMLIIVLGMTACTDLNTNKGSIIDETDYSELSTVRQQAEFFEKQAMLTLQQLGIADYELPPVDRSKTRLKATERDFEWYNPYGYLSDVPKIFKDKIEELFRKAIVTHPILKEVRDLSIGEYSQLVPESQRFQVTEDAVGFLVMWGSFPNIAHYDWIMSVSVRFDDWSILAYSFNPDLINLSSAAALDNTIGFVPATAWLPGALSIRRVVSDDLYESLTHADGREIQTQTIYGEIKPSELPILAIFVNEDGSVRFQEQRFENGITKDLLATCEVCLSFAQCSYKGDQQK